MLLVIGCCIVDDCLLVCLIGLWLRLLLWFCGWVVYSVLRWTLIVLWLEHCIGYRLVVLALLYLCC